MTLNSLNFLKNHRTLIIVIIKLFIVNSTFCQPVTWQKVLDNIYGVLEKVQQTFDGGYIAVGNDMINNEHKIYFTKFNEFGSIQWIKILGVGNTEGYWIEETSDNGFIIGGTIDSGFVDDKAYIIKTDFQGNIQWHKTFSNSGLDQCYCVKQTPDGGYILSCRTTPSISDMIMFIKTDSLGNLVWNKVYGSGTVTLVMRELQILSNGYIATGSLGLQNSADAYLMRLNLNGDTLWTKKYGGIRADGLYSADAVGSQGFILGGSSKSFNTNSMSESYVVRIDSGGNLLWQKTYSGFEFDVCKSIRCIQNIGFVMAGFSDSISNSDTRAKIRVLDTNGIVLHENSFLPVVYSSSSFNSLELTDDGGYISAGFVKASSSSILMYIVKSDSVLGANIIGINSNNQLIPEDYILSQNYPNPFNPVTNIKYEIPKDVNVSIKIYDILGREVFSINEYKLAGSYEVQFDGSNFASGMYFYKMVVGENTNNGEIFTDTKKMVLLK